MTCEVPSGEARLLFVCFVLFSVPRGLAISVRGGWGPNKFWPVPGHCTGAIRCKGARVVCGLATPAAAQRGSLHPPGKLSAGRRARWPWAGGWGSTWTQDVRTNGYLLSFSLGCWAATFTNHEEGKKEVPVCPMWQGGGACSGIFGRLCYLHKCQQYLKLKIRKLWSLLDLSPALRELQLCQPALSTLALLPVPGVLHPSPLS